MTSSFRPLRAISALAAALVATAFATASIQDNLTGHWKLDETDPESLVVINSSPLPDPGHGVRTATIVIDQPSPVGRGYRLHEENDDAVELSHTMSDGLRGTHTITVAGWVNPATLRAGSGAGSRNTFIGTSAHFHFTQQNQGQLHFIFQSEDTSGFQTLAATAPDRMVAGEWQHVAVTRAGPEFAIYLDGVRVRHVPSHAAAGNFTMDGNTLYLGRHEGGLTRDFDGTMSDWGLWIGEALSASEISLIGALGRIGLPLSSAAEIEGLLAIFAAQSGTLATDDWEWKYTTEFAVPLAEVDPVLGRHYIGGDGKVYVILGGAQGDWQGLVAEGGEVVKPPIVIVRQPEDQEVNLGETAIFEVEAEVEMGTEVHYQWYFEWPGLPAVELEGETSPTLMVEDAALSDMGLYYCIVSEAGDGDFSVRSRKANLTVLGVSVNMIGHWKLDETDPASLEVFNSAPGGPPGVHGERTATMQINQPAPAGRGYLFDGVNNDDVVVIGLWPQEILNQTNELSYAAWVKPTFFRSGTGAATRHVLISAGNVDFLIALEEQGHIRFRMQFADGHIDTVTDERPVRLGEFAHIVVTRAGTGENETAVSVYVDGVLAYTADGLSGANFSIGSSLDTMLGRRGVARDFDGVMSDVGLWSGMALTAPQISVLGGLGRAGLSLASTGEMEAILDVFQARSGTVVTEGRKWVYTTEFADPIDEVELAKGRHYVGMDGSIYVILDGSEGDWEGVVGEGAIRIVGHPGDVEVGLGKTASFEVAVEADVAYGYQWFFAKYGTIAQQLDGQTSATLTIEDVAINDEGWYFCRVSQVDGEFVAESRLARLAILGKPDPGHGLIGHWRLDENDPESLQVLNSAPLAMPEHGLRKETVAIGQASPVGTGYYFDGIGNDDYVQLGTSYVEQLRKNNELSISGWINPAFLRGGSGATSRQTIMAADSHLQFSLQNEGRFVYVYRREGAFATINLSDIVPVTPGEFTHVALTHAHDPDGWGDDMVTLYVNGEQVAQVFPFPSIFEFEIGGDVLHLGRYEGNTARDFDGVMSDMGLWAGEVLSHRQISMIGGIGRTGMPLNSSDEIEAVLAVFDAQSGAVEAGGREWTFATEFPNPPDGSDLGLGRHYTGAEGNVYVILGGFEGAWSGVKADAPDLTGYDLWVSLHFTPAEAADPAISGPMAMPAGDGVPNLLKYAFGMEPRVPAPREELPRTEVRDGELILTYNRIKDAPDISCSVEVSEDLIEWESGPDLTEEIDIEDLGGTERVTVRALTLPGESERGFMRLQVVKNVEG